MAFRNAGSTIKLHCDYCQAPITSAHTDARVGLHGVGTVDAMIVATHAGHCRSHFQQFYLNTANRELAPAAFFAELAAL